MKYLLVVVCLGMGFLLSQCGQDEEIEVRRAPTETPVPTPGDGNWGELKALVDTNCNRCHNGSIHPTKFDTLEAYKVPAVKARIENDTMPPGGGLSAEVKSQLLSVW